MSQENRDTGRTKLHQNRQDDDEAKTQPAPQIILLHILNEIEHLALAEGQSVVIGRADKGIDFFPDVDLSGYNARKQGVSRRHVRVFMREGHIYVMDMNSNNGTFLHGKKLPASRPTLLNDGDHLRLGMMELSVEIPRVRVHI